MEDHAAWNAAVERLGGSVLQSFEWGEFRNDDGWRPLRLLSEDGSVAAQVLLRNLPVLGAFAYAPHGPVVADPAALPGALEALADHVRQSGAHLLTVEPRIPENEAPDLAKGGFRRSATNIQPRSTIVVGVMGDAEEQLKTLPKDARYGVRRARREGVEAGPSDDPADLEAFLSLHEATAERQGFALRPRDYYRRQMVEVRSRLVVARLEGRLIAGAIVLSFGEEAYYLYGASAPEGENLYASYLVQFEALNVAREAGARRYDMWGFSSEVSKDHPLWGVYQFKKKFGGEEERYAGAHEKPLRPLSAGLARAGIRGYYTLQRLRGKSSGPISD